MRNLTVGDLARRVGVSPAAIRYYEAAGLLPEPPRRSGRRCYDERWLRRAAFIVAARRSGAGIRDIAVWLGAWDSPASVEGTQRLISDEIGRIDARIEQLRELRSRLVGALSCPCPALSACERI